MDQLDLVVMSEKSAVTSGDNGTALRGKRPPAIREIVLAIGLGCPGIFLRVCGGPQLQTTGDGFTGQFSERRARGNHQLFRRPTDRKLLFRGTPHGRQQGGLSRLPYLAGVKESSRWRNCAAGRYPLISATLLPVPSTNTM